MLHFSYGRRNFGDLHTVSFKKKFIGEGIRGIGHLTEKIWLSPTKCIQYSYIIYYIKL